MCSEFSVCFQDPTSVPGNKRAFPPGGCHPLWAVSWKRAIQVCWRGLPCVRGFVHSNPITWVPVVLILLWQPLASFSFTIKATHVQVEWAKLKGNVRKESPLGALSPDNHTDTSSLHYFLCLFFFFGWLVGILQLLSTCIYNVFSASISLTTL